MRIVIGQSPLLLSNFTINTSELLSLQVCSSAISLFTMYCNLFSNITALGSQVSENVLILHGFNILKKSVLYNFHMV